MNIVIFELRKINLKMQELQRFLENTKKGFLIQLINLTLTSEYKYADFKNYGRIRDEGCLL